MIKELIKKYNSLPVQLRASTWFLICSFLQKGISFITTPIFTRLLSTEEYGLLNVFSSWQGILTIFIILYLHAGVYTQGLVKFDGQQEVYSSSLQGLVLSLVSAWTVVYLLFHDFWNSLFSLTTVQMLAMLVMIWTTAVFNFWAGEQRVKYRYKGLVILTVLTSLAKPIVGIIFVSFAEDKVTARILGLVLVELVCYIWLFAAQMKRGKRFFDAHFWKHAILFNLPLIPHYLSQTLLNTADRIMISRLIGDSEAGIYSVAYSLSQVMLIFNSALLQTITPWILQKIKAKKVSDIKSVAYVTLIFIAVVNILLIAFAPEVIRIVAPKEYYDAIWVIPPISMSVYAIYAYNLFVDFELYYEKRGFMMLASIVASILNIILNYIFIPKFGYYAAGYTTLFCYAVNALVHYLFMCKICRNCMDGAKVFSHRAILGISAGFFMLGFAFLPFYDLWYIRYAFAAFLVIVAVINRKKFSVITNMLLKRKGTDT